MLRRKCITQFVNQERNTQYAVALLNCLKRATKINAKNASFHEKFLKRKERKRNFFK
jgi:hypothetical protein